MTKSSAHLKPALVSDSSFSDHIWFSLSPSTPEHTSPSSALISRNMSRIMSQEKRSLPYPPSPLSRVLLRTNPNMRVSVATSR